jgi:polysaccharide pyruvyl transferase CsaB
VSRILLSGYYGFGNAGDEAVLAAILASLRREMPDVECAVLSVDPASTTRLHGVPSFHRARPQEVLRATRRCELFVSGGGSLLQDVTSLSSLLFYLAQIRFARLLGRRVMIYAQGIGPLLRPAARRLTAQTLRAVNWITVRDPDSAAELRRIGLNDGSPPVEVAADPVFALKPASRDSAEKELRAARDSSRLPRASPDSAKSKKGRAALTGGESPRLGVSVRDWPGLAEKLELLAEVIRDVGGAIGLEPVYFPLHRVQDTVACRQLAERAGGFVLPGDYSPGEWMALVGEMQLFLGMRLHALIFAAARGVPLVGLTYDPKVTALLARLGEGPVASVADMDAMALQTALYETWNDRARRSVQLLDIARELSAAAELSARRAAELLGMGRQASGRGRSGAANF